MLKIGDKVRFTEYIPKNMVSNTQLGTTLDTKKKLKHFRSYVVTKNNDIVSYRTCTFNAVEPISGIYLGSFKKKLLREYRKTEPSLVEDEDLNDIFGDRTPLLIPGRRNRPASRPDRYSEDPNRLDEPRILDKMAMVRVGRKVIGVPMTNVLKHTYGRSFKTL